jgi:hypothetical protein
MTDVGSQEMWVGAIPILGFTSRRIAMKRLLIISTIALLSNAALAAPAESTLAKSLRESERFVNSLRMDKPSQMRVYAFDGTEYTSSEALWLKAHVEAARKALASNNANGAARELNLIAATLKSHGSSGVV